jgi:hypothetical protein
MTSSHTDRFDRILGPARGANHADVLLVEDHGGHGIGGPDVIVVFATRSEELAEQISSVHRHAARTNGDTDASSITVRWVSFAEYECQCDYESELWGPGVIDRVGSPAEEAAIMGVPWPLPAG